MANHRYNHQYRYFPSISFADSPEYGTKKFRETENICSLMKPYTCTQVGLSELRQCIRLFTWETWWLQPLRVLTYWVIKETSEDSAFPACFRAVTRTSAWVTCHLRTVTMTSPTDVSSSFWISCMKLASRYLTSLLLVDVAPKWFLFSAVLSTFYSPMGASLMKDLCCLLSQSVPQWNYRPLGLYCYVSIQQQNCQEGICIRPYEGLEI